jgi:aquaporin Z
MKYVYEFIGTFFVVFVIGMTLLEPNASGLLAPLAIGSTFAVLTFAGGHLSGAHYNPAVSFSVFLRGKLHWEDLIRYWVAQFLGALLAGYLVVYFKGYSTMPMMGMDVWKALLAEFVFTFALCYVVLNVATAKETKGNSFFGFSIGFIILAGVYAVGSFSGAAFNPSVAFGMNIMNMTLWENYWIYIVANFLAAVLAAYTFKAAHRKE